jgi:hypothetical protein
MLCPYKDLIGKVGSHPYRLFDISMVDVLVTVLAAGVFSYVAKYNFWYILLCLFLLGIISHRAFCVRSTVDQWLFPDSA